MLLAMITAWLAGGSGLVGSEVLRQLLADDAFASIVAFGRRPLPAEHAKLSQVTVDFGAPDVHAHLWSETAAPQVVFSCLGTTMKKAGSREAFRAVDHDAVLAFARESLAQGARAFLHVTALGARPNAFVFYNRVKGEIESAIATLGFESVYAFQPSYLDGGRTESRPIEHAAIVVTRALGPLLGRYRPTPVNVVARAMIASGKKPLPGAHVIDPGGMRAIVERAG
jgi:uncharacterized protein YbjT (DUF2867 family)